MRKSIIFFICLFFLLFVCFSFVQANLGQYTDTAKSIVSKLTEKNKRAFKGKSIAIVSLKDITEGKITEDCIILKDLIIDRFVEIKSEYDLKVLSRDKIEKVLTEYHFQLTDLSDDEDKVKRIGKALKADILVHGNISTTLEIITVNAVDVATHEATSTAKVKFKRNHITEAFDKLIGGAIEDIVSNSETGNRFNLSVNITPAVKGVVKIDQKEKAVERGNVSFYGIEPGKIFVEFIPKETAYKVVRKYYNVSQESYEITIKPERLTLPQIIDVKNKITKKNRNKKKNSSSLLLSTDKESYKGGEYLKVIFKTDEDCYLYLINVDLSNTTTFLFPNKHCQDNFIEGGVFHRIPNKYSQYRFPIQPPYGKDRIYAFASKKKLGVEFNYKKYIFKSIDSKTRGVGVESAVLESDFIASNLIEFTTYK